MPLRRRCTEIGKFVACEPERCTLTFSGTVTLSDVAVTDRRRLMGTPTLICTTLPSITSVGSLQHQITSPEMRVGRTSAVAVSTARASIVIATRPISLFSASGILVMPLHSGVTKSSMASVHSAAGRDINRLRY